MKAGKTMGQAGGVLILFALCLVVLFGFAGLVIDLGSTYVGKAELQNAADAGALAGAQKLNGTAAGVAAALQAAKNMGTLNKFRFAKNPVTFTDADVWIGSCPQDRCFTTLASSVTSDTQATGKYFIKVDTGNRTFDTTFMKVADITSTTARGMAVAGRFYTPITPLAICALDETRCPTPDCGFELGRTYDVTDINRALAPSGMGPGTQIWIDPVATAPTECSGNVNDNRPFVCEGKVNVPVEIGGTVYTNTGFSKALLASLDSRFGDYDSQGKCDPATAPPDTNIQGYLGGDPGAQPNKKLIEDGDMMANWLSPVPTTQGAVRNSADGVKPITVAPGTGVRGSFYPISGGLDPSPYRRTAAPYFRAPSIPGQAERRVLNMVIVSCTTVGGSCRPLTVKGVGKFLMTRKSDVSSDAGVFAEFGGMADPSKLTSKEVKLYR